MKRVLSILTASFAISVSAQVVVPSDISFDKNIVEAENHWIAREPRQGENGLHFSFAYFDENKARYFLRSDGFFTIQNNQLVNDKGKFYENDINAANNVNVKVAVLNDKRLKELGLTNQQPWLKQYEKFSTNNDKVFVRGEALAKMHAYEAAIPIFEDLLEKNFKNEELYHLLATSYSGTKQYQKCEETIAKAQKAGFAADKFYSELMFNYGKQEKWKEVEDIGSLAVKNINTPDRNEILFNIAYLYTVKRKFPEAKKWIDIGQKSISGDTEKYLRGFKRLESEINK